MRGSKFASRFFIVWLFAIFSAAAADVARDWVEFQKTPQAQQEITNLDKNLLSEAVFHRTNAERAKQGLPLLKYSKDAEKAAALQSGIMRKRGSIGHVNPEVPQWKTLEQRAAWAGIKFSRVEENVATAFDLQYVEGKQFYTRVENGRTILSYEPEGKAIPHQTYATFADAVVTGWMNSPGHRANILNPGVEFLGVSCLPGNEEKGMKKFYCTQVFFAP